MKNPFDVKHHSKLFQSVMAYNFCSLKEKYVRLL